MKTLMELYNKVQNPLVDNKLMGDLLNAYRQGDSFYKKVQEINAIKSNSTVNQSDKVDLHLYLINRWIKAFSGAPAEHIKNMLEMGNEGYDKLQAYLKTVGKITTVEQYNNIFGHQGERNELQVLAVNYFYSPPTFWTEYLDSHVIDAKQYDQDEVNHRLYINCDNADIYNIANKFIIKCTRDELKFHFKFDQATDRADKMVIYSSTENLLKYYNMLEEIGKENPEIIKRCGKPAALTGNINGWIGVGDEPKTNDSYTDIRCNIINDSIRKQLAASVLKNIGREKTVDGKIVRFNDVLVGTMANAAVDYLNGINIKQLDNPKNKASLIEHLRGSFITRALGAYSNDANWAIDTDSGVVFKGKIEELQIPTSTNTHLTIDKPIFDKGFKNMAAEFQGSTVFADKLRMEIETQMLSKKLGNGKFCFDAGTKEKFEALDNKIAALTPAP